MPRIKVKVVSKGAAERFFRCGMEFTREWQEVEVDAATARRLHEEQMLDVMEVGADLPELNTFGAAAKAQPTSSGEEVGLAADPAPADPAPADPAPADPAPADPAPAEPVRAKKAK